AYQDGRKQYQGQWVQGLKHGEGILFDEKGELAYIGSFAEDEKSGAGTAARRQMMTWYKEGDRHAIVSEERETLELDRGTFASGVQISRRDLLYYTGEVDENKVPSGLGQLYRYAGQESTRVGALTRSDLIYEGEVLA